MFLLKNHGCGYPNCRMTSKFCIAPQSLESHIALQQDQRGCIYMLHYKHVALVKSETYSICTSYLSILPRTTDETHLRLNIYWSYGTHCDEALLQMCFNVFDRHDNQVWLTIQCMGVFR